MSCCKPAPKALTRTPGIPHPTQHGKNNAHAPFAGWPRSCVAAFTLTELLVVISILAVLSALALPALRGALERADRVVCLSNLRQLGQAVAEHVADHGHYPAAELEVTDAGGRVLERRRWYHALGPYLDADPRAWSSGQGRATAGTVVLPSEDDRDPSLLPAVLRCPQVPAWLPGRNGAYGYHHQRFGDARIVGVDAEGAAVRRRYPVYAADLPDPANTVLILDSAGTGSGPYRPVRSAAASALGNHAFTVDPPMPTALPGPGGAPTVWGSDGAVAGVGEPTRLSHPHGRHQGGCCVLFADGRVDWVPIRDLLQDNRLWGGELP